MPKISKTEMVFIVVISIVTVLVSLFQLYLFVKSTPLGRFTPLIHNYPSDYYYYLSYIKQGIEGKLFVTSRFSSEISPGLPVFSFFPIVGILGGIFRLPAYFIYTAARIIFGVMLLVLCFVISSFVFKEKRWRFITFAISVVSVPFWYIDRGTIKVFGDFWTGIDPYLRIAYLPHHLFAVCMLIFTIIFLHAYMAKSKTKYLSICMLFAVLGLWTNTAILFPIESVWIVSVIYSLFKKMKNIIGLVSFMIIILVPIVYLWHISNTVFPWTLFASWEKVNFYPIGGDLISTIQLFGISGIFAWFSVPFVFLKGKLMEKFILVWYLSAFLGLFIFQRILPISNIRYLQSAFYIPQAILCVFTIKFFLLFIDKKKNIFYSLFAYTLIITFISVSTVPALYVFAENEIASVNHKIYNSQIYFSKNFFGVLDYLNNNGKDEEVVLSDVLSGSIIPAFTNKRVVFGHPVLTINPDKKVNDIADFYKFQSFENTEKILKKNNVRYFMDWTNGKLLKDDMAKEIGARMVFSNSEYILYRVDMK
jgi:hypothetical protein